MNDPESKVLGDYRLLETLTETDQTLVWLAEQVSVGRTVVVEELKETSPGARESFVADVRAKASVDHPLIGSVYEAVTSDGHCYVARERLTGPTFADRLTAGATLKPADFAPALHKLTEAQLYLEGRNLAVTPISLDDIHLDDSGVLRINNPVVAGTREDDRSQTDIAYIGEHLPPLIADASPGATRTLTLLGWMSGRDPNGPRLNWNKIRGYASQIDQQLTEPPQAPPPPTKPHRTAAQKANSALVFLGIVLGILVAGGLVWVAMRPKPQPPRGLPSPVEIPGGNYPTPDGGRQPIRQFWIAGHEVTIKQYAAFLTALDNLDPDQRDTYDAEGQPAEKKDHKPGEWAVILAAAQSGGTWDDLPMSMDCPVVNVDWWDAAAYCEWKRGRLPAQEEWLAAALVGGTKPASLEAAPWGPVASHLTDRTKAGIHDLAGSVAEWTRRPATNPALPMAGKKYIVSGGSHLNPNAGARAREWIDDRSLRRPDLGFRIAFDYAPVAPGR